MRRALALSAALGVASFAASARAVEREHELGVDVGGTMLSVSGGDCCRLGGTLAVHYTYGLTDQFNLMAEGGGTLFGGTRAGGPREGARLGLGAAYVLDVMRLVPYGGVLVEGVLLDGGALRAAQLLPSLSLALGADYRIDRRWSFGIALREHLLIGNQGMYPSDVDVLLRGSWVFGW